MENRKISDIFENFRRNVAQNFVDRLEIDESSFFNFNNFDIDTKNDILTFFKKKKYNHEINLNSLNNEAKFIPLDIIYGLNWKSLYVITPALLLCAVEAYEESDSLIDTIFRVFSKFERSAGIYSSGWHKWLSMYNQNQRNTIYEFLSLMMKDPLGKGTEGFDSDFEFWVASAN